MSNQIEIKIDSKRLTPDKFIEAAKDFFALVEGVAKNVTNSPIVWKVEVDKGSAVLRMIDDEQGTESGKAVDVVSKGIRALRTGIRIIPNGFTPNQVSAVRRLAKLVDGNDVQFVSIRNGGEPEDLSPIVVETADAILSGQSQIAFGSVEGSIVTLSAKHGLICTVYDPIQRRDITCYLLNEECQIQAEKGYRKRVLVAGLVHYAKEGFAVSVSTDTIRIFPSDSELPTIEEIQEIYKSYK